MKSESKDTARGKKIQAEQKPAPAPRKPLGADAGICFIELDNMKRTLDLLYSPNGADIDTCVNEGLRAFQIAKSLVNAIEFAEIHEREAGTRTDELEGYRLQAVEFYLQILAASHRGLVEGYFRLRQGHNA